MLGKIARQHRTGSQPLSTTLRMCCWMKIVAVSALSQQPLESQSRL